MSSQSYQCGVNIALNRYLHSLLLVSNVQVIQVKCSDSVQAIYTCVCQVTYMLYHECDTRCNDRDISASDR